MKRLINSKLYHSEQSISALSIAENREKQRQSEKERGEGQLNSASQITEWRFVSACRDFHRAPFSAVNDAETGQKLKPLVRVKTLRSRSEQPFTRKHRFNIRDTKRRGARRRRKWMVPGDSWLTAFNWINLPSQGTRLWKMFSSSCCFPWFSTCSINPFREYVEIGGNKFVTFENQGSLNF